LFSLCPDKPKRHLPRNDWELTHAGTQEPAVLDVLARMVSRFKAQDAPLGQHLDREPGQREGSTTGGRLGLVHADQSGWYVNRW